MDRLSEYKQPATHRRIAISFRLLEIYYLFVEPRKLQVLSGRAAGLYLKCIGFLFLKVAVIRLTVKQTRPSPFQERSRAEIGGIRARQPESLACNTTNHTKEPLASGGGCG